MSVRHGMHGVVKMSSTEVVELRSNIGPAAATLERNSISSNIAAVATCDIVPAATCVTHEWK